MKNAKAYTLMEIDGGHGWVYKPATSEMRADNTGTNSNGTLYYDF